MPYPPEVKAHARHVYEQAGAEAAAQATGVHVRTIREWAQHENWPRTISAAAVAATVKSQAMRVGWHTAGRNMADLIGEIGAELLEKIRDDLAKRDRVNMRDAAILFGVLMDKAELLTERQGGRGRPGSDDRHRTQGSAGWDPEAWWTARRPGMLNPLEPPMPPRHPPGGPGRLTPWSEGSGCKPG